MDDGESTNLIVWQTGLKSSGWVAALEVPWLYLYPSWDWIWVGFTSFWVVPRVGTESVSRRRSILPSITSLISRRSILPSITSLMEDSFGSEDFEWMLWFI